MTLERKGKKKCRSHLGESSVVVVIFCIDRRRLDAVNTVGLSFNNAAM